MSTSTSDVLFRTADVTAADRLDAGLLVSLASRGYVLCSITREHPTLVCTPPRSWRGSEAAHSAKSMKTGNLNSVFAPRSVAIVGATQRQGSVGRTVLKNLMDAGFSGPLHPINLNRPEVQGLRAFRRVGDVPVPPRIRVYAGAYNSRYHSRLWRGWRWRSRDPPQASAKQDRRARFWKPL